MKKIVTFLALSVLSLYVMAQKPQFEWAKSYGDMKGDQGTSIALDKDGNVYTSGVFMGTVAFLIGTDSLKLVSSAGGVDVVITKQDASGNFIWVKQMEGTNGIQANCIKLDEQGDIYLTGQFRETADLDPGTGVFEMTAVAYWDIFIAKLDKDGGFIWAKQIGSEYQDLGQTLAVDPNDGSILVTGYFTGTADFDPGPEVFELPALYLGDYQAYVLKLDVDGNFVWAGSLGGEVFDAGMGIAVDKNSDVYVSGVFTATADFDPGAESYTLTTGDKGDGFVCKLGSNGRFKWAIQLGSFYNDWCTGITIDPSGNLLITGEFTGSVDFDPGAGELFFDSGSTWAAYIWKLDPDSKLIWAKHLIEGPAESWGNAIAVDASGNPYVTGFFKGTSDFDPGEGKYELTAEAYWDIFISKLTTSGDFAWAVAMQGNQYYDINNQEGMGIAVDKDNNVYSTGYFESFTDFDPGPAIYYLQAKLVLSSGFYYEDAYIHKMNQFSGVGIAEKTIHNNFTLYPNPVIDIVTIELGSEFGYVEANILDITGKILATNSYTKSSTIQVRMDVAPGVYIIQLKDKNGIISHLKVIKG